MNLRANFLVYGVSKVGVDGTTGVPTERRTWRRRICASAAAVSKPTIDMDMTPMIDIVFQMILFFIIITDFTQQEIALLELPWSTVGIEDEGEDTERITINITTPLPSNPGCAWTGRPRKRRAGQQDHDQGQVRGHLHVSSTRSSRNYGKKNFPEEDKPHLSRRSVLVRCDRQSGLRLRQVRAPDLRRSRRSRSTRSSSRRQRRRPTSPPK